MRHRHLNHEDYTLAAVDDIIERGQREDWADLARAANADPAVMKRVARIADARGRDPHAQRYRFWRLYVSACQHMA